MTIGEGKDVQVRPAEPVAESSLFWNVKSQSRAVAMLKVEIDWRGLGPSSDGLEGRLKRETLGFVGAHGRTQNKGILSGKMQPVASHKRAM